MYSIYADDVCIYNDVSPLESLSLISPELDLADSSAGTLSFTVPPINVGYDLIQRMTTDITVYKHDDIIWTGRVLSESEDFYKCRSVQCEGALAFLNDSRQPQAEFHNITVENFLSTLISVHNSKVPPNRRFEIGTVTVTDSNNSLYRYTNYETTWDCIKDKLLDRLGGHLIVRYLGGIVYLDYLSDYNNTNDQAIVFGENLMDFTKNWDMTDFATVILPLGKRLDTSPIEALEAYLTVENFNTDAFKAERFNPPHFFNTTGEHLLDCVIYGNKGGVGDYNSSTHKYDIKVITKGKNLLRLGNTSRTHRGVTFTPYQNGAVKLNGTPTGGNPAYALMDNVASVRSGGKGMKLPPGTYSISTTPSVSGVWVQASIHDVTGAYRWSANRFTITDIDDKVELQLVVNQSTVLDGDVIVYPQLELGRNATSFEQCDMKTVIISLDEPLLDGESFSYTGGYIDTGTGVRLLSVDTAVPPKEVYIRYKSDEFKKYVQSAEGIKNYGWIEKVVHWDDVTTGGNLLTKALAYISDIQFDEMTIELSALDLHYLYASEESIKLLDNIRVLSPPHGLDRYFPVTELRIPLSDPSGTIFTLGARTGKTLTDENNSFNGSISNELNDAKYILRQEFRAADGVLSSSISQTYATKTELTSSITQTSESITTEVNKKLNSSDFGSYLRQNYNSFLLGFNNSSNVIQITTSGIGIYSDSNVSLNGRLIRMNGNGMEIWRDGKLLGKIGTNHISGYNSYRGLCFDLDVDGSYMTWAVRNSSSEENYSVVLTYAKAGAIFANKGLYIADSVYMSGNVLDSVNLKQVRSDGYSTYNGTRTFVTAVRSTSNGVECDTVTCTIKNGMFVN